MPTLQQELSKMQTLNNLTFDDEPQAQRTHITSAAARGDEKCKRQIYWEWLRDHPASSTREIAEGVGVDPTYMANILSKFNDRGLVERTIHHGVYTWITTVPEYPVTSVEDKVSRLVAARKAKREAQQTSKAKGTRKPRGPYKKRVLVERPTPSIDEQKAQILNGVTNEFNYSVNTFISQLNVHQAKAVYEELKKLFGG